jgi:phosphoglycolate phosphatase-like HAD superfamily hydrolase
VGDHPRDIDAGRNADMYTILAAYGYLPIEHRDDLTLGKPMRLYKQNYTSYINFLLYRKISV